MTAPRARLALVLAMLAVAALGLPSIHVPPGRDQGIFATAGMMVADGAVLYRDVFEVKQPFILFIYAALVHAAAWLGIGWVEAVNLLDQLVRLAAMPILYLLGARLFGRAAGVTAAAFFGLSSLSLYGGFWNTAQAESFAGPLTAVALLAVLRGRAGTAAWPWVLAGAAAAAAALFKATAAAPALVVVLAPWEALARRAVREALVRFAWAAAGAAVVALPLALYFVASGALDDFIDVQFDFNRHHGWHYPWSDVLRIQAAVFLLPWRCAPLGLLQTAALIAALVLLIRGPGAARWIAVCYGLAWITVPAQGKLWLYHYVLLLPAQAVLTGWCVAEVTRPGAWRGIRALASAVLVATVGLGVFGLVRDYAGDAPANLARFTGRMSAEDYLARPCFQEEGQNYRSVDLARAAAALRGRGRSGDGMMVFGLDQTLNALAGILPTTRYIYSYPLVAEIAGYAAQRTRRRAEFLAAMKRRPPRFLVVPAGPLDRVTGQTPGEKLAGFTAFFAWAREHYTEAERLGAYQVFELRSGAAARSEE